MRSRRIGYVPAGLFQLARIADPALCICVYLCVRFYDPRLLQALSCSDDGCVHACNCYMWPDLQKRTITRIWNAYTYFKEAYFHYAMCNLSQNLGVLYRRCCCSNDLEISPRTAPSGLGSRHFWLQWVFLEMVPRIPGMEGASVFLFGMV